MRGFRLNSALASTALALVLATPGIASAEKIGLSVAEAVAAASGTAETSVATATASITDTETDIAARVPMPEWADLAPPTAEDVGGPATGSIQKAVAGATQKPATDSPAKAATATVSIESRIPVPEAADVPPPSIKDIAAPASSAAPAAAAGPAAAAAPAASTAAPAAAATAAESKDAPAAPAAAAAGKEPAAIAAGLAAADVPVAEKLRDLVSGKFDKLVDRKKERAAVEAFYTARGFAPLWIENGAPSARAKAAVARLKSADLDGLDPRDYAAPDLASVSGDALAEAEIRFTGVVLTFARHASAGRFPASRLSNNIDVPQTGVDPADALAKLADSKDVAKTLDGFDPPHEGFRLLKVKLGELLHRGNGEDSNHIGDGPALKLGMQDPRVPLVRARLDVEGDAASTTYDAKVAEAVKKYQRRMEMKASGILDARTIEALNGPPRGRQVDAILATMERWRWMPRDLGKAFVMVNLPDFSLKMVNNGKLAFHTRIVVGKPSMPTPIFSNAIENIIVNPTWHVPESIVYKEYLPALAQDPTVLARMGLNVSHDRNGRVVISQPPGAGNALGRMKFNFPNKYNVYLHDTPDKNLFHLERRAFSHGCMRVQNPPGFGEALLAVGLPEGHYSSERLQGMFGRGEEWLKFKTVIPVHITYQTAYVDDAGKLVVRDDIYGLDGRVLAAVKSTDMRIAEISSPAPEGHRERPAGAGGKRRVARQAVRPVVDGGGFFERLFR